MAKIAQNEIDISSESNANMDDAHKAGMREVEDEPPVSEWVDPSKINSKSLNMSLITYLEADAKVYN